MEKGRWENIDLFAYRMRSQGDLKNKLGISSDEIKTEFAKKQFDAAINFIEELNPEVIVVANALARDLITEYSGDIYQITDKLDQELGCYHMELAGTRYPILFSGMLTGQRALDTGSRERLKWQIDRIKANST